MSEMIDKDRMPPDGQPRQNSSAGAGLASAGSRASSLSDRVRSLRLPDRPAVSTAVLSWLPWAFCLLLAGLCGYLGYRSFVTAPATEAERTQTGRSSETTASEGVSGKLALDAGGYIIPVRRVQVSPKVSGMIVKLN